MRGLRLAVISCTLAACAGAARPHRPLRARPAPSHSFAPPVASFAPTTQRREKAPIVATAPLPVRARRDGGVSDGALIRQIRAREHNLYRCFLAALRADPALRQVKVPVRVRIGAEGNVVEAHASGGVARLDRCVTAIVSRMSFTPPGSPVEVEVPLLFTAR